MAVALEWRAGATQRGEFDPYYIIDTTEAYTVCRVSLAQQTLYVAWCRIRSGHQRLGHDDTQEAAKARCERHAVRA